MLTYIGPFGAVFFIWCENALPTPLFSATSLLPPVVQEAGGTKVVICRKSLKI